MFLSSSAWSGTDATAGGSLPDGYDCAQEDDVADLEDLYGPGNVTGISGNGGLTAGFGYAGELTVLRWPTPSYHDQIRYRTPFLTNACPERKKPRNGADENMGSFAGLVLVTEQDPQGRLSWFRDPDWNHVQYYLSPDSAVLVTESVQEDLGLSVKTYNVGIPVRDILVRHYDVVLSPSSPVRIARALYYENLQIVTEKISHFPINDSLFEMSGDFAALYHEGRDALIHFRPQDPRPDMLMGEGASQDEIDRWIDLVDTWFPHLPDQKETIPVYLAVGADFSGLGGVARSDGHQCGLSESDPDSTEVHAAAFCDCQDGALKDSSRAAGNVDAALVKQVEPGMRAGAFTVFIAAADRGAEALRLLDEARVEGWESLLAEAEAFWAERLKQARLPATRDPTIRAVCKRALITVLQGYIEETGAFVASVTTQPPYNVNWPRDGVYFAHLMDQAGFHEIAEKNLKFYASVQRNCRDAQSPRYDPIFCPLEPFLNSRFGWILDGTYEMAYYADGMPGAPIFYEIDNAGFANWGMWQHTAFLGPEERFRYLCDPRDGVYRAVRRTADALAGCITPGDLSGLQCRALEDDTVVLEQTLNGAMAVYMGIDTAIRAGSVCGEEPGTMERWTARREELSRAIEEHFWNEDEQHYEGLGPGSYLLWPAGFPLSGDRFEGQASYLFSEVRKTLNKEVRFSAYIAKAVLALALYGWDSGDPDANMKWALDVLLKEVPTPLWHYGEGFLVVDVDGDGTLEFHNRVAVPHLWEATLAFLAAAAYYGLEEPASPDAPGAGESGGCGCSLLPQGVRDRPLSRNVLHGNLLLLLFPCSLVCVLRRLLSSRLVAETGGSTVGKGERISGTTRRRAGPFRTGPPSGSSGTPGPEKNG